MKKILLFFLVVLAVSASGFALSPITREYILNLGMMTENVPISGTGSMYPTFPKSEGVTDEVAGNQIVARPEMRRYPGGIKIFGKSNFNYELKRGDIIEFESETTKRITSQKYGTDSGFVKRIIALPGDQIELRDGFVLVNGEIQTESYTAKPRSTYGGEEVPDCRKQVVPAESVFVLGDNRKASLDSRFELGFVKKDDIHFVLPFDKQDLYRSKWRDTANDLKNAHTPTADPDQFLFLLNKVRKEKNRPLLKLNPLLNDSASIRGNIMLKTDDFSIEATRSGLTLEKSIRQAGYHNIIFAELFTKGFYETGELFENLFEFPETGKLLLSGEYEDLGLSAVLTDIRDCPTQVIVIHLGGYRPPKYDKNEIESWKKLIDNLTSIIPSWEQIRGAENINREKVDQLIILLTKRLNNAQKIYQKLSKNEWLTEEENALLKEDTGLHSEAEKLITELNN